MKVLVWRYYGNTDVFCAESGEQILKIAKMVLDATDADWWTGQKKNHRTTLGELVTHTETLDVYTISNGRKSALIWHITEVADTERESGDDNFQEFDFTTVEY